MVTKIFFPQQPDNWYFIFIHKNVHEMFILQLNVMTDENNDFHEDDEITKENA